MALTPAAAIQAAQVAGAINAVTATIAAINDAIASQSSLTSVKVSRPSGGNEIELLSFPLDPVSSAAALNAALTICNGLLTNLNAQLAAFP